MLLCPIQNTAVLTDRTFLQKRPRISQEFGKNPQIYARFNMKGHNGIDFGVPTGTPVFAPMDGFVLVGNSPKGYGKFVKIRNGFKDLEVVLGHFDSIKVVTGQRIAMGDVVGLSGNTGFSTGPHLHFGIRRIRYTPSVEDVFAWGVLDYDNGYLGYIDPLEFNITWKGTLTKNNL